MRRWARTGAALLLVLALVALASGTARAAERQALVTLVHGLPEFTADIYVDGKLALDGFRPETAAGPIGLPPGSHRLAVRDVGADPASKPVLEATATLRAGEVYTVVAHLTAAGGRALTVFREAAPALPAGRSRLVVRDVAEAPAFDLLLDGGVLFRGLRSSDEAAATRPPGRHSVEVRAAVGAGRLVRPIPLTLQEGSTQVLYVVGSAKDGTLDLVSQDLQDSGVPSGGVPSIPAGSGGLAAPGGVPGWAVASAVLGLLGSAASSVALRRRRPAARRAEAGAIGPVARPVRQRVPAPVLVLVLTASLLLLAASPAGWAAGRPPGDAGVLPAVGAGADGARTRSRPASGGEAEAIPVRSARLVDQPARLGPVPVALRIASVGVDARVVPVGLERGTNGVSVPADVWTVGWYRFGPSPGEAGSSLLVGHVDSAEQGAGAFFRLGRLRPGARIVVRFAGGSTASFTAVARRWYRKGRLPTRVFDRAGPPVLTLVTCGGAFDAATGHYANNVAIYAVPSTPSGGQGARPDQGG